MLGWSLEEAASEMFDNIVRSNNIPINMSVPTEPETLMEYIEGWRMKLWETAYTGVFKGGDTFKKSDSFKDFKGAMLAVKRLIYRYFKFELYAKKAIEKADLPPFLMTWLDRSSSDCMFSPYQLRNWTTPHLQACPWYLECNMGCTPIEEETLFRTLKETAIIEPEFDEFAGLDPEAKAKAIIKREAADKKKVDRLEEARKRMEDNKMKRLASKVEKEQEKTNKKGTKRKAEELVHEPATSGIGTKETSSEFSLTQNRLVHGLSPTIQNFAPVPDIDECILNLSVESLPSDDKAFENVLTFLDVHSSDKDRYFDGALSSKQAVDLIIVDVPEGLHVPTVSAPPDPIPKWNEFKKDCLVPIFDFAQEYLHDKGGLLIMYPAPSTRHKSLLLGCYETYGFRVLLTWLGMNHLHLTSPADPNKTTMRFSISLLVRESGPKTDLEFPFQYVPSHEEVGVNIARDDILQNFCNKDDVTMNRNMPWRGPREKARQFMQMLIEGLSEPGDIVVDCTAATEPAQPNPSTLDLDEEVVVPDRVVKTA